MWKFIILIGIVVAGIFSFGYFIGIIYAHQHKEYERKFAYLEMAVRYSLQEPLNYETICQLFDEIRQYDECTTSAEAEKLDVLEREFENKFKK